MKKSRENDRARLLHMLEAAQHASEFSDGMTRSSLEHNILRQYALAQIKGMRNRLAHAYFDINLDVLWYAVTVEMPALVQQLEDIIDDDL